LKKCEQIPEAQIIEEINAEIELDLSLAEYLMRILDQKERQTRRLLTVYFGAPSMFITLWFGFDYGTNSPLGTLII
jgi:hypothetical protein